MSFNSFLESIELFKIWVFKTFANVSKLKALQNQYSWYIMLLFIERGC